MPPRSAPTDGGGGAGVNVRGLPTACSGLVAPPRTLAKLLGTPEEMRASRARVAERSAMRLLSARSPSPGEGGAGPGPDCAAGWMLTFRSRSEPSSCGASGAMSGRGAAEEACGLSCGPGRRCGAGVARRFSPAVTGAGGGSAADGRRAAILGADAPVGPLACGVAAVYSS